MSFLNEHKLLLGAVGIALSSAAAGYVFSRTLIQRSSFDTPFKVLSEGSPVAEYVLKHGIREPSPLAQLRRVMILIVAFYVRYNFQPDSIICIIVVLVIRPSVSTS